MLAASAGVALPIATTAAYHSFGILAHGLTVYGAEGLLMGAQLLPSVVAEACSQAMELVPHYLASGTLGAGAIATVEKISGKRLVNFSIPELVHDVFSKTLSPQPKEDRRDQATPPQSRDCAHQQEQAVQRRHLMKRHTQSTQVSDMHLDAKDRW